MDPILILKFRNITEIMYTIMAKIRDKSTERVDSNCDVSKVITQMTKMMSKHHCMIHSDINDYQLKTSATKRRKTCLLVLSCSFLLYIRIMATVLIQVKWMFDLASLPYSEFSMNKQADICNGDDDG